MQQAKPRVTERFNLGMQRHDNDIQIQSLRRYFLVITMGCQLRRCLHYVMRRPFKPSCAVLRHEPRKSSLSLNVAFGRSRTWRRSPRTNIVLRRSFAFSFGCVRSKVCRAATGGRLCCAHSGSHTASTVGANNRGFVQAASEFNHQVQHPHQTGIVAPSEFSLHSAFLAWY